MWVITNLLCTDACGSRQERKCRNIENTGKPSNDEES